MKNKLSAFVLTSVLGLTGTLLLAQDQTQAPAQAPTPAGQVQADGSAKAHHGRHAMDPDAQARHMAKKLSLTSDQQSQVADILKAQREQAVGLRNDTSLTREDRRAKMQSLRSDSESKIRALLNDNQKQSFDQMLQQRKEHLQNQKG